MQLHGATLMKGLDRETWEERSLEQAHGAQSERADYLELVIVVEGEKMSG